jgi:hypothetical protein
VDAAETLIRNVDFVQSVSVMSQDLSTLAGNAGATPRQDVLPHVRPEVFFRPLLARCFTNGMRWIAGDREDSVVAMQEYTV